MFDGIYNPVHLYCTLTTMQLTTNLFVMANGRWGGCNVSQTSPGVTINNSKATAYRFGAVVMVSPAAGVWW